MNHYTECILLVVVGFDWYLGKLPYTGYLQVIAILDRLFTFSDHNNDLYKEAGVKYLNCLWYLELTYL